MSAVIFALLLVATALGLERYSTAHSLDDVQGRLEVEDHLVEAGEPAVIHLVVRNSGPRWKMFLAAKLHLNKEFLPCTEHHITQDQTGWGHTVRFTTWLRPGQEADFSTALRLERRGRAICCFPAACWRRCVQGRSCSAAVLWLPVQRRLRLPFTLAGSCRCCSCF